VAVGDGHGQGAGDQAGAQVFGEPPAGGHLGGQAGDRGQVQPAPRRCAGR
jgi:hypothetical protein